MLQKGAWHANSADPAEHPAPMGPCPVVKQRGRKCLVEHSKSAGLILFLNERTQKMFCFSCLLRDAGAGADEEPRPDKPLHRVHMVCVETGVTAGSGSYCLFVKGHQIHIIN